MNLQTSHSNEVRNTTYEPKQFYTVKQLADKHHFVTLSALRWYIFHSKSNGLHSCIRRVGRKILIDNQAFLNWIDTNGGGNA